MSAPRPISRCFRCGESMLADRPTAAHHIINLTYEENRVYRVKCHKCGQYIEFNADSYEEAFKLYNAMFEGQTIYPIEDLTEDDGIVLCYRLPVEEPPDITCLLDTEFDENQYTHFSYLPLLRWIDKDGKPKKFDYWGEYRDG